MGADDQCAFAAEAEAVYQTCIALLDVCTRSQWSGRILWLIDCQGVIDALQANEVLADRAAWNLEVRRLLKALRHIGVDVRMSWVPSHFKKVEDWTPPAPLTEQDAQEMNDFADGAATQALSIAAAGHRAQWHALHKQAKDWQTRALKHAQAVGRTFLRHLRA
jgi:hypothetical protein